MRQKSETNEGNSEEEMNSEGVKREGKKQGLEALVLREP